MKLLLISSEPLNPANILTSTFELTQAVLLTQIASVAILSVSLPRSLPEESRQWLSGRKPVSVYAAFLKTLFTGQGGVNRYDIEGIPVYEGNDFKYYSKRDWDGELRDWIRAGYAAFLGYVKANGYPDFVHAHGRFIKAGALAVEIGRKKSIPFFYTEHSTVYQTGTAPDSARAMLNKIIRGASAVIAVSSALRGQMEMFLKRKLPGVIIQPNVLDPLFEQAVPDVKSSEPVNFICVASLHKKKGLGILIQAFYEVFGSREKYRLTICGDGPQRRELELQVAERGLTNQIVFTGNLSKSEVRQRIDQSHVLVLSSLQETFGVAVIEALSRGCPVIATRSGGPEAILTDEDGILVEPGSAEAIAGAMRKMTESYSGYNRSRIRERAIKKYGGAGFLERARELYKPEKEKQTA